VKYRIIEVFDADISPWFRLQKSHDGTDWVYISSGSSVEPLKATMGRLAAELAPVIIAEAESNS
jgi:hypothetical protein